MKIRTALVICPSESDFHAAKRQVLGLSLGERNLFALKMSGIEQLATVGDGPPPRSSRVSISTMDAETPRFADSETHFALLSSDVVFDKKLLEDSAALKDNFPLQILPIHEFPQVVKSPEKWLESMGGGSTDIDGSFALRVRDKKSMEQAKRALLRSMRKPIDGFVSRHLNRYISLFVTRFLIRVGITPNVLTGLVMIIGILSAVTAAMADNWWMLILAGFLFQSQSVLDGCDGEVARLTYRFSTYGQWLDTIGDDVTNYFFYLGLAIGQARVLFLPELYYVGGFTFLCQWALSFILYQRMIKMGTGDLLAIPDTVTPADETHTGPFSHVMRFLRVISKRDFFVLFVAVLTAAGEPLIALIIMTIGTYPSFVGIVVNEWRLRKMEKKGIL